MHLGVLARAVPSSDFPGQLSHTIQIKSEGKKTLYWVILVPDFWPFCSIYIQNISLHTVSHIRLVFLPEYKWGSNTSMSKQHRANGQVAFARATPPGWREAVCWGARPAAAAGSGAERWPLPAPPGTRRPPERAPHPESCSPRSKEESKEMSQYNSRSSWKYCNQVQFQMWKSHRSSKAETFCVGCVQFPCPCEPPFALTETDLSLQASFCKVLIASSLDCRAFLISASSNMAAL